MIQRIKSGLKRLAYAVKDRIRQEVHTVVELLKKRVSEVKMKLEGITASLEKYVKELGTWMDEAKEYINAVKKYVEEIMKQLDGENRKKIDKAAADIDSVLSEKVGELNKWIETAEDIRQKAESTAKEAYDKLQVHEELSKNVKKIVDAKNKIDEVSKHVTGQLGSLQQWNEKAKGVVDGAIKKAQEVHDELQSAVVQKVEGIGQDSNAIKAASENLGKEVEDLGKWKNAVSNVIVKADKKCDEILKKVKTSNDGTIFTQAKELQDKGKQLLTAASEAKQKVEQRIKDALEAVKAMDADLKRDLKEVKDKIKEGIKDVMSELKVGDLGKEVEKDLKELRERIEGLNKGDNLVNDKVKVLKEEHEKVKEKSSQIKEQTEKRLDSNFESAIKTPLEKNVQAVKDAIGKLYKTINPDGGDAGGKKINDIIDHIKDKVGNILNGERSAEKKGLQGIANGLMESYAGAFRRNFGGIVQGWVSDSVLMYNGVVWDSLKWQGDKTPKDVAGIAGGVKSKLTVEIKEGEKVFQNSRSTDAGRKITQTLTEVMNACQKFADALDGKIHRNTRGNVSPIISKVEGVSELKPARGRNSLKPAEAVLCALSTASRQVSKEIDSILLDKSRKN
ncbi:hypothetical protein BBBOND_0312790 [Babesia bigemina]|uniref:Extracellular matrix-binding ebh n=1 Tax=Babesia bigemina TaxID=5866 RepID=A0A061D9M1_BABBI|nr:hypothetical protein BBBOND_0312790 [Babesia bigemina]CDR97376.1 hypothetical protein BBBOND_0312790 [Babesia bigemina]|eukprot:XP_012769562.1 hypothetical protein BBBOND_0312790 [Babesia bigemina]